MCVTYRLLCSVALVTSQAEPGVSAASELCGTYELVSESDGNTPRAGARITIAFADGELAFQARKPGESITDTGRYTAAAGAITIAFANLDYGAIKQKYSLDGGALTLPFKILSDGDGSSRWKRVKPCAAAMAVCPASPNAYGRIEEGAPMRQACHARLGRSSAGTRGWVVRNYRDGQPVSEHPLCTVACVNSDSKPVISCDDPSYQAFFGKVIYASAGALEPGTSLPVTPSGEEAEANANNREALYSELAALVRASQVASAAGKAKYMRLGGPKRREQVKQEIVLNVMRGLIPYDTFRVYRAPQYVEVTNFRHSEDFSAPLNVPALGSVPMATRSHTLYIYESAFYDIDPKTNRFKALRSANELAAELLHEYVHWKQESMGGAEIGQQTGPVAEGERLLHELAAYEESGNHPFYKTALTSDEKKALVDVGRTAVAREFMKKWATMSDQEKKHIADWAWGGGKRHWISAQMISPTSGDPIWPMLQAERERQKDRRSGK